jgi:two-component system heavy metal sensor histidine kinase CusS
MQTGRIGIKIKMTLAFSAVFTTLALIFNADNYQHIRGLLVEDSDRYLLSRAASLLEKTEVNPAIIPLPDKGNYIRVFYHMNGLYRLVFESPGLPGGIRNPIQPGISDTLGMRVAYVRNTGNNAEDNPAELLLVTSAGPLTERIHSLIYRLFISSLISVLIAGCFSYLLARVLLLPLQRIIETARSITSNQLRNLIPVRDTRDELQELTETINAMLTRIAAGLRQQQNFFASASHELKTPLAILRAELELNLNQPGIHKDIRQLLKSQLAEIKRLQERVDEFLVISQLKEGTLSLRTTNFDLSTCILRIFNQFMILLSEKHLTPSIRFDPEADGYFLDADEDKICIVLLNLLENAIKYSVPGTTVACLIRKPTERQAVLVEMENSIPEEKIDTALLQEAFYRGDTVQRGAGLGLWLCSEIVRLHNGTLTLQSADYFFNVSIVIPLHPQEH